MRRVMVAAAALAIPMSARRWGSSERLERPERPLRLLAPSHSVAHGDRSFQGCHSPWAKETPQAAHLRQVGALVGVASTLVRSRSLDPTPARAG